MWKPWAVAQLVVHTAMRARSRTPECRAQLSRIRVERVEINCTSRSAAPSARTGPTERPPDRGRGAMPRPGASLSAIDAARVSHRPSPGRRVVIAEDEALIRMDLAEMLGEEGYDVVGQAGDEDGAIRLAEELRPDLVILDVKMPVLDGIAAAERIAVSGSRRW